MSETELYQIDNLISDCLIADLNPEIKRLTKDILQNARIKLPDAIIAATAIYMDLPILTFDAGFNQVAGLKLYVLEK